MHIKTQTKKQKPIKKQLKTDVKVQKQDFDNFFKTMIKTDKLTNKDLKKKK